MAKLHRGFFAEKYLEMTQKNEAARSNACGNYIEELDYFEKEKIDLLKQFQDQNVADDIYVLTHRDDLI